MFIFLIFLICPILLIIIFSFVIFKIAKSGEGDIEEKQRIHGIIELPSSMSFYYSKWRIGIDAGMMTGVTFALFSFFYYPGLALIGTLIFPFTLLFGCRAIRLFGVLRKIKNPAIVLSEFGFMNGTQLISWESVDDINVFKYKGLILVIKYKDSNERKKKIRIDLASLSTPCLLDYIKKYNMCNRKNCSL